MMLRQLWARKHSAAIAIALILCPAGYAQPPDRTPVPPLAPLAPSPRAEPSEDSAEPPTAPPRPPESPPRSPRAREETSLDALLAESRSRSRRSGQRMARTPEFFGDNLVGTHLTANTTGIMINSAVPLAGGSGRVKIADHNKAYPVDRVFFNYHHFHNALKNEPSVGSDDLQSLDRYTFGLEKTFADGIWSVELRMPLVDRYTFESSEFELRGGNVGNLAINIKRLIYENQGKAATVGLGIDTPTGSDLRGRLPNPNINYSISNDSVHLLPYAGVMAASGDVFFHGFLQMDITLNGNEVIVQTISPPIERGVLTDQNLIYLDVGGGYWFYRDCCCRAVTGLAGVIEYHYTTGLQDGDFFTLGGGALQFSAPGDLDISNLTVGLHAELGGGSKLRVGGVFPVSEELNRFFDSEVMVSFIRHF